MENVNKRLRNVLSLSEPGHGRLLEIQLQEGLPSFDEVSG